MEHGEVIPKGFHLEMHCGIGKENVSMCGISSMSLILNDELGSGKFSQMKLVSKQTYNLSSLKHALQGRFWGGGGGGY